MEKFGYRKFNKIFFGLSLQVYKIYRTAKDTSLIGHLKKCRVSYFSSKCCLKQRTTLVFSISGICYKHFPKKAVEVDEYFQRYWW